MGDQFQQQPPRQYAPQPGFAPAEPSKGFAVTSLVLGIVGLVFSIIPWCGWLIGWPCDIIAIVFGAVGISKAKTGEASGDGMARAGLICGIVGLAIVIAWIVFLFVFGAWNYNYWYRYQ